MDERVTWIMHRGVKILSIDLSYLRCDGDLLSEIEKAAELMKTNTEVRYLLDLTGNYIPGMVVLKGMNMIRPAEKNMFRGAFLGLTGYKEAIIKTITFVDGHSEFFRERQAALDFLSE